MKLAFSIAITQLQFFISKAGKGKKSRVLQVRGKKAWRCAPGKTKATSPVLPKGRGQFLSLPRIKWETYVVLFLQWPVYLTCLFLFNFYLKCIQLHLHLLKAQQICLDNTPDIWRLQKEKLYCIFPQDGPLKVVLSLGVNNLAGGKNVFT